MTKHIFALRNNFMKMFEKWKSKVKSSLVRLAVIKRRQVVYETDGVFLKCRMGSVNQLGHSFMLSWPRRRRRGSWSRIFDRKQQNALPNRLVLLRKPKNHFEATEKIPYPFLGTAICFVWHIPIGDYVRLRQMKQPTANGQAKQQRWRRHRRKKRSRNKTKWKTSKRKRKSC